MDAAVEKIFECSGINFKGKSVLVKPNMAVQCGVQKAATTHPALVKAVVWALKKRGTGEILVGENPGLTAYGIYERCARISGILDAAGECFVNLKRRPMIVDVNSDSIDSVRVSSEFF